jgi:uncharacterized membrane protein YgcG
LAIAEANQRLEELKRATGWEVVIETIPTLGGRKPIERAQALKVKSVFIVIATDESSLHIVYHQSFPRELRVHVSPVIKLLAAAFSEGEFDQGLLDAVSHFEMLAEEVQDGFPTN